MKIGVNGENGEKGTIIDFKEITEKKASESPIITEQPDTGKEQVTKDAKGVLNPQENALPSENEEIQYEYVDVKDAVSPFLMKLKGVVSEHFVFVIALLFITAGGIFWLIGGKTSVIVIFLTFVFLSAAAVFFLMSSWKTKKAAQEEAEKAEMLFKAVSKKKMEDVEDE